MSQILLQKARSMFTAENAQRAWDVIRREAVGLAQDFWKDGDWKDHELSDQAAQEEAAPQQPYKRDDSPAEVIKTEEGLWHALPGEISERMWGRGFVTPCDERFTEMMCLPMGLTKNMSMLDLSAGLGERMRQVTHEFGIYITGREPDPEIAARGMEMSQAVGLGKRDEITAYDPMNLLEPRLYDCVIARETIYRVGDKEKFIKSIVDSCKSRAQVSFTDYIVNPEAAKQPAIALWRAFEQGADPIGLIKMAEIWAKAGMSLRVHDDQTEYYKREVKQGLVRFAEFMATGVQPDGPTKKAIQKRIATWGHRLAALDAGMKVYRFYGTRS